MGSNDYFIVVTSGSLVAAARIDDGDETLLILLHFSIRKSKVPQQFHPAHFEPDEIVRVIDHSHLISLCVTHTQTYFARAIVCLPIAHLPLQRGFRFSRNELTPSRKSAVCRIPAFCSTACAI